MTCAAAQEEHKRQFVTARVVTAKNYTNFLMGVGREDASALEGCNAFAKMNGRCAERHETVAEQTYHRGLHVRLVLLLKDRHGREAATETDKHGRLGGVEETEGRRQKVGEGRRGREELDAALRPARARALHAPRRAASSDAGSRREAGRSYGERPACRSRAARRRSDVVCESVWRAKQPETNRLNK